MKAWVFPGQGAQFVGMGKNLYDDTLIGKELFEKANKILGLRITSLMFEGTDEDLKKTEVTQPAIFLHSVILAATFSDKFAPNMVAGHSLGEFSALVAAKALSFEDGLRLVMVRAQAMQKACDVEPSTMAAVLGLDDKAVEKVICSINEVVVPANYNGPQQIVISGSLKGIEIASQRLKVAGAKRIIPLNVGGAFHSPLMEPARVELAKVVNQTIFNQPTCPIYQNVNAKPATNPAVIRKNLIAQLISPVRWHQTVLNMIADGADTFIEVGPGTVLQNLIKSIALRHIKVLRVSSFNK
ncbi:MAG: ACP S-malonyltransferase [Patescibacteria group bacterium]